MHSVKSPSVIPIIDTTNLKITLEAPKEVKRKRKKRKRKRRKVKSKPVRGLSISISMPASPVSRLERLKIHSAPVSPALECNCMTPPNSPIEQKFVEQGWFFI